MPPVDILSAFIKADYQRSLLLFTCLTLDLHATDAEPRLALLVAFYTFFPGAGSSVSSGRFFQSSEVFRKNLPDLPRSSGRVFRVFRQSSEVFRKSLPGLPRSSGRVFRAFRKSLPASSSSLPRSSGRVFRLFRKSLPRSSGRVFRAFPVYL